jgi:hypothetical protein
LRPKSAASSIHDNALFFTGKALGTTRDGDYLKTRLTERMSADAARRQSYRTTGERDGDRDAWLALLPPRDRPGPGA